MIEKHFYSAFGLKVDSEIILPELLPFQENSYNQETITISFGEFREDLDVDCTNFEMIKFGSGACVYNIVNVAWFYIQSGSKIVIQPYERADQAEIRAYLLGTAFGTLLHQKALMPLHISAISTPSGAIAFGGASGSGKSTIIAAINRLTGWPIICDDLAVVRLNNGKAELTTASTRIKLWRDALNTFGSSYDIVARDLLREDKFHVTSPSLCSVQSDSLKMIYALNDAARFKQKQLRGVSALQKFLEMVYRPYLVDIFGNRSVHTQACAKIVQSVPVFKLDRPKNNDHQFLEKLIATWMKD